MKRHKAAGKKISRLQREKGIQGLSGSANDPRRDPKILKRYTKKQVQAYINELNRFTSRGTQFVPDAQRRPVPGNLWNTYKNLEKQFNKRVDAHFNQVADVYVPRLGMTIRERMAMMTPDHPKAGQSAVHSPYNPPDRRPTNVASRKALERLIGDMKERLKPSWFDKKLNEGRDQFGKMAKIVNDPALEAAVNDLSPQQFDMLWNYTPFASAESLVYEIRMSMLSDKEKPWHTQTLDNALKDMHELVSWAKSVDLG